MFGIGWTEMIVVGAIALIFMGEEKFPDFVKVALRAFKDFRGYWDEIKHEVEKEVRKPLEREFKPLQRELTKLSRLDPDTYIRQISPTSSTDKPVVAATSPDMGTPSEGVAAIEPDEPAGTINSEDAKVMAAGTTPYLGGGLGARPEPSEPAVETTTVVEETPASAPEPQAEAPREHTEHDDLVPPSRLD